MGLLRVVGNRAIKKMSLKIEKLEKIAKLAVSTLNAISSLISKALSDNSISDEEYSLILLGLKRSHERKMTYCLASFDTLNSIVCRVQTI